MYCITMVSGTKHQIHPPNTMLSSVEIGSNFDIQIHTYFEPISSSFCTKCVIALKTKWIFVHNGEAYQKT